MRLLGTRKIFLDDSYVKEFFAKVLDIRQSNGKTTLILDETAFHPIGGGQPQDTGIILGEKGKLLVEDVYEDEFGNVIHQGVLEGSISIGERVKGIIDWERRHKLMRVHTAAHLLIQAVRAYFNSPIKCVSAGKSVKGGRLDFKAPIKREMLPEIENIANKIVSEDRRIIIKYMSPERANEYLRQYNESLELYARKHELEEKIRIIEIENWIAIPCGGTHVKRTGEIGRIRLLKRASKGRGIVRIEYTVEP